MSSADRTNTSEGNLDKYHAPRDGLDDYAAALTGGAHPPEECGDPTSCPGHARLWWSYHTGKPYDWCEECQDGMPIEEESVEEQIIPDRRISGPPLFRAYYVTRLACGHEIAEPLP